MSGNGHPATGMPGRVLIAGTAAGPLLILRAPLGFWGGVDPATGRIVAARHPDQGADIAGRILALPGTIGSSSSSAVMLELLYRNRAPAGLVLAADAILSLGVVVAREMGYPTIPVLEVGAAALAALPRPTRPDATAVTAEIAGDRLILTA